VIHKFLRVEPRLWTKSTKDYYFITGASIDDGTE